jgi:hypothetical protein
MRDVLYWSIIVVIIIAVLALVSSCSSKDGHLNARVNQYLKDVLVLEDNNVVAVVELPDKAYGILFLDGDRTTSNIVIASGDVELGVFETGEYRLYLDVLFLGNPARVETEFLDFVVSELPVEPKDPEDPSENPPEDPPIDPQPDHGRDKPTLTCNYNEDGAAALIIEFNSFSTPMILRRIDDLANDLIIDGDLVITDIPLRPGEYTFQLLDPNTEEVVATCIVNIPAPPGHVDDDPLTTIELPPKPEDPRVRFIVKHGSPNSVFILVPWNALRAHLEHGDEIGFGTVLKGCKK